MDATAMIDGGRFIASPGLHMGYRLSKAGGNAPSG
jgi:hypothetical protein